MIALAGLCLITGSAQGQGFVNLDFESGRVVSHDPTFGWLDWNIAAPGWSHSSGSSTSEIYYKSGHFGATQLYMLYDSLSPSYSPGALEGNYSMGFSNGIFSPIIDEEVMTQAYLSQTGTITGDIKSIAFLGTGNFQIFMNNVPIHVESVGGNAFVGDVSAFAGTVSEFKIVNLALGPGQPVVVDRIQFSTQAVPEPCMLSLVTVGACLAWHERRKCKATRQS
ncbi:MAG: hypothetical protein JWN25_59 [Verrucomicrobiales bacterium]|nr:hypothetical protein [Verrucomicrobiales bacterium]